MSLLVTLTGPPPWGFRLSGGMDFGRPLTISKVNGFSNAEKAGLLIGDVILEINGRKAGGMLHFQAQQNIKSSILQLVMLIHRPKQFIIGQTRWSNVPVKDPTIQQQHLQIKESNVTSASDREHGIYPNSQCSNTTTHTVLPSSSSLSKTEESIVSNSKSSLCVPNQRSPFLDSGIFQRFQMSKESTQAPRQSNTFRLLQKVFEEDGTKTSLRHEEGLSSNPTLFRVQRFRTCEDCGTLIITQAVKIEEGRHRHQECYTCKDCGLSLLTIGHFWVGKDLFCGKHAQRRYQKTR